MACMYIYSNKYTFKYIYFCEGYVYIVYLVYVFMACMYIYSNKYTSKHIYFSEGNVYRFFFHGYSNMNKLSQSFSIYNEFLSI